MKNKYFYNLEYAILSFFLINSFFINVGYNSLINGNNDFIIDIIIGSIIIISFISILLILRKHFNKSIIELFNSFKYLKYPLFLLITIIIGLSTIYSIETLTNFINYYILKEIDPIIITLTLIFISLYLVSKNIKTIARVSEICFYIYMLILIIVPFSLINYIDITNLKPLMTSSINNHIKTIITFFNYSILPIFLIINLDNKKYSNKDIKKILIFIVISTLVILIQAILIITILGTNLASIYNYPDIMIYKKISFLNIFERVEVFLSFNQILNGLFFIVINLLLLKNIMNSFIKKKKEKITLSLLGITFIILSSYINISKNDYLLLNISTLLIILIYLLSYFTTCITKRS